MDKKAQAQIITVVLIILLVLAAIVIVWQVVRSTVQESAEEVAGGTECITMDLSLDSISDGDGNITIVRGVGAGSLDKIKVIIDGTIEIEGADASDLEELESKTIDLPTTHETAATGEVIEIAGILENGKLCNIAATRTVVA